MLSALSDFAVLFGIVAVVLLVMGLRRGWFIDARLPRAGEQAIDVKRKPVSAKLAQVAEDAAAPPAAPGRGHERPQTADIRPMGSHDVADPMDDPAGAAARAVTARARSAGLAGARAALPDHWPIDVIQQRTGWLAFDVRDFLGEPHASLTYPIPGQSEPGAIDVYPVALVREVERTDTLIAASRRRTIEARWRARQQARAKAKTASPRA